MALPDPSKWKLHLKNTTPLIMENVISLPTSTTRSKDFLMQVLRYMTPNQFENLYTSRTIKPTGLSQEDIDKAVSMGKFERCDSRIINGSTLPLGVHGVNVFAVPEHKGRRRLITEPHLNAVIAKHEVPKVEYPTRLGRRQSLRHAKYMIQIDFEAFYDSIPIPESIRNNFVFRARDGFYYRLRTLPTGARWSVAVGQGVTGVIVDVDTQVIIHTLIDNIMVAAHEGQERQFLWTVHEILRRIRLANLMTSPDRDELDQMEDKDLLRLATKANVFLGEEYAEWNGTERLIRNSAKTVAKLQLALRTGITQFTHRSFASLVSLILYALHTTQLNPAKAFKLLRAYRGIYRQTTRGYDWDDPLNVLEGTVYAVLQNIGQLLARNEWWNIADVRSPSYENSYYDFIAFTDASALGWGAVVQSTATGQIKTFQQKWVHDVHSLPKCRTIGPSTSKDGKKLFNARHSAHAEPRAISVLLKELVSKGLPDGSRLAVVTDHFPIVHAQRRINGYGGIGRGYTLNRLFEYTYDLLYTKRVEVTYFYLAGAMNPADALSRRFGVSEKDFRIVSREAGDIGLPRLALTYSPLCEEVKEMRLKWKDRSARFPETRAYGAPVFPMKNCYE